MLTASTAIREGLAGLPNAEIIAECESGREAIEAIRSQVLDLVLLVFTRVSSAFATPATVSAVSDMEIFSP
jgi:hypothetical protein